MKLFQALAKMLYESEVRTIFGLAGDANLYFLDFFSRQTGCRHVASSHEGGSVLMAEAFASVTGAIGVVSITHGPGLTNTATALVQAVKSRTPLLVLCGDTDVQDIHHTQNIAQREFVLACGAGFEQHRAPQTLAQDLKTAIRRALTERRPIVLNLPISFQWVDLTYESPRIVWPTATPRVPTGESLDAAIGIVATAKRPVILAGRGAMGVEARASLLRLAKRIEAPVGTTLKAQNLFAGEYCNLGVVGSLSSPPALDVMALSDCVICFGASLGGRTTLNGALFQRMRVIQCNAELGETGQIFEPDVALLGDIAATADLFVHWLDVAEIDPSGHATDDIDRALREYDPVTEFARSPTRDGTINIGHALAVLDRAIEEDRIVAHDGGRFVATAYKMIQPRVGKFFPGLDSGSIGLGMAHAVGAACANRSIPTIHVTGDGGFMMGGLAEFNTAVREQLDLIVVICNDGAYGSEHIQFRNKGMDPLSSTFAWPEFSCVANALGGQGYAVRDEEELKAAVVAIQQRDRIRPILIDLKLDPDHIPAAR